MSAEKQQLLMIKGAISDLPEEDQKSIKDQAEQMKESLNTGTDKEKGIALMALSLVVAEIAAEQ